MTQKLHENIAAIATNFGGSDAFEHANEQCDGWIGVMRSIIHWAETFSEVEGDPNIFDWYMAIDDFVALISNAIMEDVDHELPTETEVLKFAEMAILAHKHSQPSR